MQSNTITEERIDETITCIWADVLGLAAVDRNANFFELGGDSMKAMDVISRVGETLGVELPLMVFFEDPSVAHMAEFIDAQTVTPATTADTVAKIWSDVLGVSDLDRTASFFDLGGDSMKAMDVIARVGESFGVELPLMAFFEDPTVASVTAFIDSLHTVDTSSSMQRDSSRREFPLAYFQEPFWLLEQRHPGIYNTARIFGIRGQVDAPILESALNELVGRHEILRVRFEASEHGPVQIVETPAPLKLDVVRAVSEEDSRRYILETIKQPLKLDQSESLRARLIQRSENHVILCIAIHHAVSDGVTGSILLDELVTIYDAFAAGQGSPLPDPEFHFTDFAAWQREWMTGERLAEEVAYWRTLLENAPRRLNLPTDFENKSGFERRGALRHAVIPADLHSALESFAQANGTTLFSVLSAAFRILLYRWSGQADFVLGTIASNRSRSGTERMIGCFVNPLPLRNKIETGQSVADFLNAEKASVMNAFAHQDCPFTKIVETVNPERTDGDNPLFNVALLLQDFPEIKRCGAHFDAEHVNFDAKQALLDLRIIATETSDALEFDCEYSFGVFKPETIECVVESYIDVLRQMVAQPEAKVDAISISAALVRKHKQTIAVAANFTAEPLEQPLAFWMRELEFPSRIKFAPFDQIFQQLLDPGSLFGRNSEGFNLVLVQWRDGHAPGNQAQELAHALKTAALRKSAPFLVCVCPPAVTAEDDVLRAELAGHTGIHLICPGDILDLYPITNYRDEYAEALGAIPYTQDFYVALASMLARRMYALRSTPYKVIALDCDNTLWKGVCGEDGPLGVQIDPARKAMQEFLLAQREAGMLLCLCSKNVEADVDAVFEKNHGMALLPQHITARRINWQTKSQNLRELAAELNLGLDSFILIDDNPIEAAEVRANCPETLVIELPEQAEQIPSLLRHVWAFDHWNVTDEDRKRAELYAQEREREQARTAAGSLEEFLRSLELKIDIHPMQPGELSRVAQLTQRTNQFNCTTIRRSEAEITHLLQAGVECLTVSVRDRFGDYGLVGVVLFAAEPDALAVNTFLLSCRALGRKVEHAIVSYLGEEALRRNLDRVDIRFTRTEKNQPALDFLEAVGREFREGHVYRLPATHAVAAATIIQHVAELQDRVSTSAPVTVRADLFRIASQFQTVDAIAKYMGGDVAVRARPASLLTPTEEILSGIWASVLRATGPEPAVNFFELGGNSLLGVQMISRVRQAFGVELPLRALFEAPVLSAFAERIDSARRNRQGVVTPPLVPTPRTGPVAMSFAQQRLWFIDQLEPGQAIYNIPQMTCIRGPLNIEALDKSLREVVRRHEALRTTFHNIDGQPMQVISETADIGLAVTDASPLSEAEIEALAREEAARPFDLTQGVLRARLLRRAHEEHILLVVMHHIVGDRWSAGIFAAEMEALYAAFVRGEFPALPELPVQYADFALWQRGWLQGEALEKQVAYWKRQLASAPAVLDLPTDRPRPAVLTHKGSTESRLLSADLIAKLTHLSHAEGATLFMTLLAGLQALLCRYSGQDDIVVGSPIAGRNQAELEYLIGFFVNTLALRGDLSGNPTFRELLGRVKTMAIDAYAHQDVPFERLVEELQPERSLSYQPIFQILFALQNAPQRALELAGLTLERLPLHQGTSAFDMSWFATHVDGGGILLRVEYNTDLFDAATIRLATGHFERLLTEIAADANTRISDLALLDDDERRRIVQDFNNTAADYPHVCIHDMVAQQAARTPKAVAIVDGARRISYAQLNARANQIAHYLLKHGAGPDTPVAIFSCRSAELVTGILGILKSGSPYVPLDPAYPTERLAHILEDAQAPILLTQSSLAKELPPYSGRIIRLDTDRDVIAQEPESDPQSGTGSGNLAYILFTSGSTGRPKGVAIEHRTPVTFIHWAQETFTREELAGVLFSTSVCFDVSMFEMFVTLSSGGKLIVAENALALPELPARNEITLINAVPSVMAELARVGGIPASVEVLNLAGEALPSALVDRLYQSTSARKVYNLYGPTETSYATFTLVKPGAPVTIGKPLSNTFCYVLDSQLKLMPIGVQGELYIAGDGVARGYYRRPELTAQRFSRNPFAQGEGRQTRMYKTGDRCRWLPNGELQYLGRLDYQVKLRGFRIELAEIETIFEKHPAVERAIALVREDEPGRPRLLAYVVPANGEKPRPEILQQYARKSLPDFMVPSDVLVLEAFPLTTNGKIDRKALPAPERARQVEYLAPETATERALAKIWSTVLHIDRIGAYDNFFALGGHSLLAMQVISRVRASLFTDLPVRTIFEAPTLQQLAARVDAAPQAQLTPIPVLSRTELLPLSFAQQRLWFMDQLFPDTATFNLPWTMRLTGPLDLAALQSAIDGIVSRHEALRTVFVSRDGQPALVVHPKVDVPVKLVPVSSEQEWRQLAQAEIDRPYDLSRGPLLRATVFRLGPQQHVLVIVLHHIVGDRWSTGVLNRELASLYTSHLTGTETVLPELAVQYADYAAWQRNALDDEALGPQLSYWKEQLRGVPQVVWLPTDRPRRASAGAKGATASLLLPAELVHVLDDLAQREGATMFMLLLAAFQTLLARYSGQDDLVIGTPVANRNRTETENLIGLFVNTLPLRAKFDAGLSFIDLLAQVRATSLAAYANQDLPFDKLVEELQPERSLTHDPLVQIFFALQNAPVEDTPALPGITAVREFTPASAAKGDMFLSIGTHGDELLARLEYNADIFDASTIERMLGHFRHLLEGIVENPACPVLKLPLLAEREHRQILVDWNATEADYPRDMCLHTLFERQAARSGHAVACISGDRTLTYRELNERANQLAHELQARGAGPSQKVAICLERGFDLLVSLLGVQKSGAAYVPLDPAYPPERIRMILEDADPSVLVTSEALLGAAPVDTGKALCVDLEKALLEARPKTNPVSHVTPQDLIYVIFTSGSTGRPKGVQVPHSAVVNLLLSMGRLLDMGPGDIFPALASFAFDMCIPELYLPLVTGGKVFIGAQGLAGDGVELARLLEKHGATIVHATPTTWNLLLQAGFTGRGLKRAIGAEALPQDLCRRLLAAEPTLYNFYGPTETTVWSTVHHFRSAEAAVVIGKPMPNQRVYILDRNLQPVPVGVPGEIHIAGDGLTCGYLNTPDLTAQKFIADPFGAPGKKMYKTGDLGRYLADGTIEFWGRADNQVKVRGYRIELGEVETALGAHPDVRECAVIVMEPTPGDKRLVAYVVSTPGCKLKPAELRLWLKDRVPDYMTPSAFVELASFPLTPNGKVDRRNLPAPKYNRSDMGLAFATPRSAAEEVIAGIWASVLRLDAVGIHDNFFELGGHSLLATQILSRVRDAFQVDLPLRVLFDSPTVAGMAEAVQRLRGTESPQALQRIVPVSRKGVLPLSFAQQRLWFIDQIESDSVSYNVPWAVRMTGRVHPAALESALNHIVSRHEVLRTVYHVHNDVPVQVIQPAEHVTLVIRDLSAIPAEMREREARRILDEEAAKPFCLAQDVMLRSVLVKLGEEDHILLVTTHHIASDGWSLGILASELAAFYRAALENKDADLPELPFQYADFAVWQREWIEASVLDAQFSYWKRQLTGAPPVISLPLDHPRPSMRSVRGAVERVPVPQQLLSRIEEASRRLGSTSFLTMLAAFECLLRYYTKESDIIVGTDLAGRTNVETEALIGFFVNVVPLRIEVAPELTFAELVARVREVTLSAHAHQDVPLDKIVEGVQPERIANINPLIQVLFVHQNTPKSTRKMPGIELEHYSLNPLTKFDLAVFYADHGTGLTGSWVYNPDLFEPATVAKMAQQFETVLDVALTDPQIQVSGIEKALATRDQQSFQEASRQKLKGLKRRPTTLK